MSRKDRLKRNLGGHAAADDRRFTSTLFDGPDLAELRAPLVLPERLFRSVLHSEIAHLADTANEDELRRFFSHFFDVSVSEEERESYVKDFQTNTPKVTMGYPRLTGEWPVLAIILSSEGEAEAPLANHMGETLADEITVDGDQEYEGTFFDASYSIYVIGTHPDQCLYLYHFAKFALLGARSALVGAGVIDPHYSGSELNPEEAQLPDWAFGRVLSVSCKTLQTIPKLLAHRDGRNLRLTGLFRGDVVVNGLRGGVETYTPGDDDADTEAE